MTREEERVKAAKEHADSIAQHEHVKIYCVDDFISGAKWADEYPRKGLVDIEKACEWLEQVFIEYAGYYCAQEILDGFRKAMEE